MEKNKFKKICVSILGPLGDVVNTSPIFRRLRECYPKAEICIITTSRGLEASYGIPEIDKRFVYSKSEMCFSAIKEIIKFKNFTRKTDLYIVLDNSFRAGILSFISGAKVRCGRKGQCKEIFLTHYIEYKNEELNEEIPVYEHYYRILKPLGIYNNKNKTSFTYSKEDKEVAENLLNKVCTTNKPKLGICLFTAEFAKSVDMPVAVEIMKELYKLNKYELVVVGGTDVTARVQELSKLTDNCFIDLTGKLSYSQSACIIDNCDKFLSIDTSPMHLAIALRVPVVAIFFTHIYKKWGPENLDYNRLILNLENKNVSTKTIVKFIDEIHRMEF